MKLTRCNTCHANIHLDALVQDNSAKTLLATVAKLPKSLAINVIGYVALFRPAKSDLNNDRAARLINEVLELSDNKNALNAALEQTVQTLHAKRQQGTAQPLKNHSYLNKVIETIKDQYFHPVNGATKQKNTSLEVKQFYQESDAENKAKFEEMHNKFRSKHK
jgi:glutaminase